MKILSLFSGAGGMDLGLVKAGHRVVWANDIDKDAVETYRVNIGDHILDGDITKFATDDLPEAGAVIGGFPCQGFSQANLLRSLKDSRNVLYREFCRVVDGKRPSYFLAENVRGILSLDGGEVINKIVRDFKKVGYRVQYQLFNMADYGIPQSRFRVIIAGTRCDLPMSANFLFPEPTHANPKKLPSLSGAGVAMKPWVSIGEALSGIPDPEDCLDKIPNHTYSKYKVTNRNFTGHRTTDPDKPSPTILARGNGGGGVCAIQHPRNHRRMSIRESAILQTFPLNFVFKGKMNSCYRQVGNAVPVSFARKLGERLAALEKMASESAT